MFEVRELFSTKLSGIDPPKQKLIRIVHMWEGVVLNMYD